MEELFIVYYQSALLPRRQALQVALSLLAHKTNTKANEEQVEVVS
jgi:hypothetical protein